MNEMRQTETVTIKTCCTCSGGLLERDRFCRWCGARQTGDFAEAAFVSAGSASLYTTSALEPPRGKSAAFRPVSGPLVKAMMAGMSAGSGAPSYSRAWRAVVQMLVSIPIWLMIVLLSPFDAYAAAKTISRHFTPDRTTQTVCKQFLSPGDFN
jgi:hypothetical protein